MATIQDIFDEKTNKPPEDDFGYEAWNKKQEPTAFREVLTKLQPTIDQAVNTYAGTKAPLTVHHRARIIAAKAIRGFDPSKGASLKTHVYNQLRRIQRMAPNITDPFSPPERFRQHQTEITEATARLEDALGREPTDEELAETTGLKIKRVIKMRNRMRARIPYSVYEDSDDDSQPDIVEEERSEFDDWVDAVYHDLGPMDRLIMMYRTGYRNTSQLSNTDIAAKLGVTPALVSQRAGRIQKRVDEYDG